MKRILGTLLGQAMVAILLSSFAQARAQGTAPEPPPLPPGPVALAAGPGEGGIVDFGMGPGGWKVVTGAPFSAQITSEFGQTLSDGNHIHRMAQGAIYRDSQGRVRREGMLAPMLMFGAMPMPKDLVFLEDPVAHTSFTLVPDAKVAAEGMKFGPERIERMEEKTEKFQQRFDAGGGDVFWMSRKHGESDEESTKQESLGTQTIEGVKAEGTRVTRTIPAGAIGNEKPIEIVVEKWYSPDLQTDVLVKRSDPRMGESVYKLTKIDRAEPAAALFQVPPDYTIKKGIHAHRDFSSPPPPPPAPATP